MTIEGRCSMTEEEDTPFSTPRIHSPHTQRTRQTDEERRRERSQGRVQIHGHSIVLEGHELHDALVGNALEQVLE